MHYRTKFVFLLSLLSCFCIAHAQDPAAPCIQFVSPRPGSIISAPACTLELAANCKLTRIRLRAEYLTGEENELESVPLGELVRPPYKMLWRLDKIPNQLFEGAVVYAEGVSEEGTSVSTVVEGVFLCHNPPAKNYRATARFLHTPVFGTIQPDSFRFTSPDSQVLVNVKPWWNTEWVGFDIQVQDDQFHTALDQERLKRTGIELMIDRNRSRLPYPSASNASLIFVPLAGTPLQVFHKPVFSTTGSYQIQRGSKPLTYPCSLTTVDFQGYSATVRLPKRLLGTTAPDSIGINVLIRYTATTGEIKDFSWSGATGSDNYAPFVWGTLAFGRRFQIGAAALWTSSSFVAGLVLSVFIGLVLPDRRKKYNSLSKFEQSEEEQGSLGKISDAIHSMVTDRAAGLNQIAGTIGIPPAKVNKLLKKYTGSPFLHHLIQARVELAKERLRSSHSSEKFIAESCGFESVEEMERCFRKFAGTTPYRFRQEFHVT